MPALWWASITAVISCVDTIRGQKGEQVGAFVIMCCKLPILLVIMSLAGKRALSSSSAEEVERPVDH